MSATRVRFFGRLADEAGRELTIDLDPAGMSVAQLRARLARELGAQSLLDERVKAAVNAEMVAGERKVLPGDEVEFLAPLSGG